MLCVPSGKFYIMIVFAFTVHADKHCMLSVIKSEFVYNSPVNLIPAFKRSPPLKILSYDFAKEQYCKW